MSVSGKDHKAILEWDGKDIYSKDGVRLIIGKLSMLYKKDKLHETDECK